MENKHRSPLVKVCLLCVNIQFSSCFGLCLWMSPGVCEYISLVVKTLDMQVPLIVKYKTDAWMCSICHITLNSHIFPTLSKG